MTQHYDRALLSSVHDGFLNDGSQFPVVAVNGYLLRLPRHGLGRQFAQILIHLIGEHRRKCHLAVRGYHHHRRYPLHAIAFRDVRFLKLLQFTDMRIAHAILFGGGTPFLHVGIHGHPDELHASRRKLLVHPYHLRSILAAVRTPRCPEVKHNGLAFQLRQAERLAVNGLHLEVRCHGSGLYQLGGILRVVVGNRAELRPCCDSCQHQGEKQQFLHTLFIRVPRQNTGRWCRGARRPSPVQA